MNVRRLEALAVSWRGEASTLEKRGALGLATALRSAAEDLETTLREWRLEELSLQQAAEESGYSYSALQKRLAGGDLPNVGDRNRPRIRRQDLPAKGAIGRVVEDGPDLVALLGG